MTGLKSILISLVEPPLKSTPRFLRISSLLSTRMVILMKILCIKVSVPAVINSWLTDTLLVLAPSVNLTIVMVINATSVASSSTLLNLLILSVPFVRTPLLSKRLSIVSLISPNQKVKSTNSLKRDLRKVIGVIMLTRPPRLGSRMV